MNRPLKIILLLISVIFLTSGGWLFWQYFHKPDSRTVEIVQDNQVLYKFSYPTTETKTFRISDGANWNEISLHDGTICMSDANCPDLTCVHMGNLQYENLPIVCLPHKLVIRFSEEDIS